MISVKSASEEVLPRLLEIEREVFTNPWTFEMFVVEFLNPNSFFTVISENNTPLGFCILRRMTEDEGQLFNIAVTAPARRQKLGDTLMRVALRDAEDAGLMSVFLEVRESSTGAIWLYKKHGFEQIGVRPGYYDKPDEDAIVMQKNIIPGAHRGCRAGGV